MAVAKEIWSLLSDSNERIEIASAFGFLMLYEFLFSYDCRMRKIPPVEARSLLDDGDSFCCVPAGTRMSFLLYEPSGKKVFIVHSKKKSKKSNNR